MLRVAIVRLVTHATSVLTNVRCLMTQAVVAVTKLFIISKL